MDWVSFGSCSCGESGLGGSDDLRCWLAGHLVCTCVRFWDDTPAYYSLSWVFNRWVYY